VKGFIACRRYESLSLHHIVQGFSTSACEWLTPPGTGEKQTRVPVSDALKRRELLEDFLFWYFDSFLLPLLKVCFHFVRTPIMFSRLMKDYILCYGIIGAP
jgi:telomerase reverse transcriptase